PRASPPPGTTPSDRRRPPATAAAPGSSGRPVGRSCSGPSVRDGGRSGPATELPVGGTAITMPTGYYPDAVARDHPLPGERKKNERPGITLPPSGLARTGEGGSALRSPSGLGRRHPSVLTFESP